MQTVYFMGAGATKAEFKSAPLIDDLLKGLNEKKEDKLFKDAYNFITELFYNKPPDWPNIEDVLSLLDLTILEQRPLTKEYNINNLQKIRDSIVYLISKELKEELKEKLAGDRTCITKDFVTKIDDSNSTIISFNYDLIIDNAALLHDSLFLNTFS